MKIRTSLSHKGAIADEGIIDMMDKRAYDILIIGGGASGMAAAIAAKRKSPELSLAIAERNDRLGRKLYATGNGRCNLSNADYPGNRMVTDFFDTLGLALREEDEGRIYPFNGSAATVVRALTDELERLGVELLCGCRVERLSRSTEEASSDEGVYELTTERGTLYAKAVILATGGKAGSEFGCTGDGLKFARTLGLKTRSFYPVLTPVECCGDFSEIKGVRAKALATLSHLSDTVASEYGEVQFTEYGLSGICIMNLSHYLKREENAGEYGFGNYFITLDFAPDGMKGSSALRERLERDKRFFYSLLPEKLATRFENFPLELDAEAMYELIRGGLSFGVLRPKGWEKAQCSGGGVELSELEKLSCEAINLPGLFVTGELLDFDGPCGGYNLGNAWETGLRAGEAAVLRVGEL